MSKKNEDIVVYMKFMYRQEVDEYSLENDFNLTICLERKAHFLKKNIVYLTM
jgi:hypothetical protein